MLTDQELQNLRNMGNEAESAADEICSLRALLAEASKQARHPDYDWPLDLQREVDAALRG